MFEQAKMLKVALEKAGVSTFVCEVAEGKSIADEIIRNLDECKLVVILGSRSYGTKTESVYSTYNEMEYILENKPFFLVKACDQFIEPKTKFSFPKSVSFYSWPEKDFRTLPVDLVPKILMRLEEVAGPQFLVYFSATKAVTDGVVLFTHALKKAHPDKTVFWEESGKFVYEDMVAKVNTCKNVILLLTNDYVRDPYRMLELNYMLAKKKNICLVIFVRSLEDEPFDFKQLDLDIKNKAYHSYMKKEDWAFLKAHHITEANVYANLKAIRNIIALPYNADDPVEVQQIIFKKIVLDRLVL
jgi:hypothetical protein